MSVNFRESRFGSCSAEVPPLVELANEPNDANLRDNTNSDYSQIIIFVFLF
jgi:hypothetical protein